MQLPALRCFAQGTDQYAGVGDDDELTVLGGGDIGAESVVKPPAADRLSHGEHFRSALRVGDAGEHAVGGAEILGEGDRFFVTLWGQVDEVVAAVDECRGSSVSAAVPDAFAL